MAEDDLYDPNAEILGELGAFEPHYEPRLIGLVKNSYPAQDSALTLQGEVMLHTFLDSSKFRVNLRINMTCSVLHHFTVSNRIFFPFSNVLITTLILVALFRCCSLWSP